MVDKQANSRLLEMGKDTQWQPGQSGNPNGRRVNSVTTLLKNRDTEDNQKVANKLYDLALAGDMSAIREYIDRTDGKVTEKHLNINVSVTPESLQEAQDRLLQAKQDTDTLLDKYPKRITERGE